MVVNQWKHFLDGYIDPLTTYGIDWLRRFVPKDVARVSLVQGDTGPVNFMFQGDHVSAIIDWETAHWGDPMEDLGNIMVREFYNPCGGLSGLFELSSEQAGVPYSRFGAQYYAVHQNVRGMSPIHNVCVNAHARESVAAYLCFRYAGDRATCEVLAAATIYAQDHDVAPHVADPFAKTRVRDVKTLISCMDRKRRYGPD